jgi:hypothetical protein
MAWLDETRLDFLIEKYVTATIADHDPNYAQRRIETRIHRDNIRDQIHDYLNHDGIVTDNPTTAIDAAADYLNFDDAPTATADRPPETWLDESPRYWKDELTRTQQRGLIARFDDPDGNRRIEIRTATGDARWHAVSVQPVTPAGPAGLARRDLGQYRSADELTDALELRLDHRPIQIPADVKAELAQFEDRVSRLGHLVEASERLRETLRTGSRRQVHGAADHRKPAQRRAGPERQSNTQTDNGVGHHGRKPPSHRGALRPADNVRCARTIDHARPDVDRQYRERELAQSGTWRQTRAPNTAQHNRGANPNTPTAPIANGSNFPRRPGSGPVLQA